jgi:hypothetical protein
MTGNTRASAAMLHREPLAETTPNREIQARLAVFG